MQTLKIAHAANKNTQTNHMNDTDS